ncbi:DMT family transporter [Aestuariirhabdus litorea]|uniref:DMT family transporter n=1 Tax=Aestuariirhabdus litorea TaxID=2528527 RepID=A0A3P3VNM9_9GAMM|nr:DMT family transporter [Aestuariirhabdus litorea]RRJ83947.1 DMT family transporter [Aestuariirhabdus litorea]RWW97167.1 DMT family transporter [Endozoicomonadaceae bacterium GTF-13]
MPLLPLSLLTALTMVAFAGNSLLCRAALLEGAIDPASFTSLRLLSGALCLWLLVTLSPRLRQAPGARGSWPSALALFAYAAGFSFAYTQLSAASGALLLFGAVQASMIGYGLWRGERLNPRQWLGFALAITGLVGLLLPGLQQPPLIASLLMIGAGVAWGVYSLRGRGAGNPTRVTAGNFLRAVPLAALLSLVTLASARLDGHGALLAIASGALASGLGYALWYRVLPALKATQAATVQLSVPVIAALGGALLLGEAIDLRLLLASAAILGGIALVILSTRPAKSGLG